MDSLLQTIFMDCTTGLGIHLPWEVSEHTYLYIQHLNTLFHYTFETDDKVEQRRRLNKWIKYHHKVVSLVTELNTLTKGSIGVLSLVCSLVVAVTVNQVLKGEKTFAAIVVGVGWFYSLTINCITGQAIINQTASITTNIQSSKWYKGDIPVKKDILFAIMCSQRPFTLNALPLGTLNLELLLMVVQTSYSYVTLLANTT
uniref:Uncharacterized protein LOC114331862 n=1 Tax=Diabrotica virgifera virgifera TaxID=50390 RepID=A0A6P7FM77_DIAVI